jgi:hypothetical protein
MLSAVDKNDLLETCSCHYETSFNIFKFRSTFKLPVHVNVGNASRTRHMSKWCEDKTLEYFRGRTMPAERLMEGVMDEVVSRRMRTIGLACVRDKVI